MENFRNRIHWDFIRTLSPYVGGTFDRNLYVCARIHIKNEIIRFHQNTRNLCLIIKIIHFKEHLFQETRYRWTLFPHLLRPDPSTLLRSMVFSLCNSLTWIKHFQESYTRHLKSIDTSRVKTEDRNQCTWNWTTSCSSSKRIGTFKKSMSHWMHYNVSSFESAARNKSVNLSYSSKRT